MLQEINIMLLDFIKKYKKVLIAVCTCILLIFTVCTALLFSRHTYYKGIYVAGLDLSGLNKNEAFDLVNKKLEEEYYNRSITLAYKNQIWSYSLNDFSVRFSVRETLDNAYKIGHTGNIFRRLAAITGARIKHYHADVGVYYDSQKIVMALNQIKRKIDKTPVNAKVIYKNGIIKHSKDENGLLLDVDNNLLLVENYILKKNFDEIFLRVDEITPKISYKSIVNVNHVLSSFKTVFDSSVENRSHNISISCEKINGTILMPGEIFSMNAALGPRTAENGYKEAKVILQNELVDGMGGGVCQVTTTLYDAVLLSMLEIIERTPHSLVPAYVQPGQDATIADDYIDFKFQNNKDYPISISTSVRGGVITVYILGINDKDIKKVKLVSKIVKEYTPEKDEIVFDDSIQDNEKLLVRAHKNGCLADLYRQIFDIDGRLLKEERISENRYKPVAAQYKVNRNYSVNTQTERIKTNG